MIANKCCEAAKLNARFVGYIHEVTVGDTAFLLPERVRRHVEDSGIQPQQTAAMVLAFCDVLIATNGGAWPDNMTPAEMGQLIAEAHPAIGQMLGLMHKRANQFMAEAASGVTVV